MNSNFETEFISEAIRTTPFADAPAKDFFAEWCKLNTSIVPESIPREEWEKRKGQEILEKNDEGMQTLFSRKTFTSGK